MQTDPDDLLDPYVDTEGHHLRVTEVSGSAGDIFVTHANPLHARAAHTGSTPRFLGVKHIAHDREDKS